MNLGEVMMSLTLLASPEKEQSDQSPLKQFMLGKNSNRPHCYTGAHKDWHCWVFSFRSFNLNHSWILSQLSYERVLTSEVFSKPPCLIAKIKLEKSVQLDKQ